MKHRYTLLSFLLIILLGSCGVQKRLYRPGFYFPERGEHSVGAHDDPEKITDTGEGAGNFCSEEQSVVRIVAEDSILKKEKNFLSSIERKSDRKIMKAQRNITENPDPIQMALLKGEQQCLNATNGITETKKAIDTMKRESDWDSESWVAIGAFIILFGLCGLLVGLLLELWNPVVGKALMCAGAGAMLVGFITIGAADPELFAEFIIKILFEGLVGCLG